MAEQIRADISNILELNDALKQTIAQVDFVISEQETQIQRTKEKLEEVCEIWRRRKETAYQSLTDPQADFGQAEYDHISAMYARAERIYQDYLYEVSVYKKEMDSSRQSYGNLLQKSSYILTRYAQLLRKSAAITATPGTGTGAETPSAAPPNEAAARETGESAAGQGTFRARYELPATRQTWRENPDGSRIYNTPEETGRKLDSRQGKEQGYLGTCGLVSCVNILRLAGYPATESEIVRYASTTPAGFGTGKLCTTDSFPECNGGTSAKGRQQILSHFGIQSELRDATIRNLSDAVCEGRGVIISVYAGMLYYGWSNYRDLHAVTVTSVKKDRHGNVLGFYVCDSGTGGTDSSRYYTVAQIENALSGRQMNVTSIIR